VARRRAHHVAETRCRKPRRAAFFSTAAFCHFLATIR
jgi:hypothetical protein